MILPREKAARLAADVLDGAIADANTTNTDIAERCGMNEKSIRNARNGAQQIPLATLLQVDGDTYRAIVTGFDRTRESLYGTPQVPDLFTALNSLARRSAEMGVAVAQVLPRVATQRTVSQDSREALSGAWVALVHAGDEMVRALDASRGDR